jgi:hypothetical protein
MTTPRFDLMTKEDLDEYLNILEHEKLNFYHNPFEKDHLTQMQNEAINQWWMSQPIN